MLTQIFFIIAMGAFAVCFFTAARALLSEGFRGVVRRKKPLYLSFSVYVLFFVLYLVVQ